MKFSRKLQAFLRGSRNTEKLTLLWLFLLIPLCTAVAYGLLFFIPSSWDWVNAGRAHRVHRDLRSMLSIFFGLLGSLYLVARSSQWARSAQTGGRERCRSCGKVADSGAPPPPPGYESGCAAIILTPAAAIVPTFLTGLALERWAGYDPGAILLFAWLFYSWMGFFVVRGFRLAALDERAIAENPVWKNYERQLKSAKCPLCGGKFYAL